MRKRQKQKKHSCPLCKSHKMGWGCRWTHKDADRLKRSEQEILDILKS